MQRNVLMGTLVGEGEFVTLAQVCRVCRVRQEWVVELVDEGAVEPVAGGPDDWRFDAAGVRRLQIATRLQRDLGINSAGAALAIQLIDEIEQLRALVRRGGRA